MLQAMGLYPKQYSFMHRIVKEKCGLKGVIYLPPRSPQYNPVEWVFAYIKRIIRHQAPDSNCMTLARIEIGNGFPGAFS